MIRVGVTRAADRVEPLVRELEARGATAVLMPTIASAEPEDWAPLDRGLGGAHDGWVFASARAVEVCGRRIDLAARRGERCVAAVGSATAAALEARGVSVDVVPDRFTAEALLEALQDRIGAQGPAQMRWFVPRAAEGRTVLEDGLRAARSRVDVAIAYRTVAAASGPVLEALAAGVDAVTLASGSAARRLLEIAGREALEGVPLVTIGPVTTEVCRSLGLPVAGEATEARMAGLAGAAVAVARDGS